MSALAAAFSESSHHRRHAAQFVVTLRAHPADTFGGCAGVTQRRYAAAARLIFFKSIVRRGL
jgi:hypothetical protein